MDLLEIQQLHAQYIRQPLTIDMPVSAGIGVPLSLSSPSEAATAARTQWNALAGRGRSLLLVLGGLGVAAAMGMSAASWMSRSATTNDQQDASIATGGQTAAATPTLAATSDAVTPVAQSQTPSGANLTADPPTPATPRLAERPDEPPSASPGTAQPHARRPAAVTTPPVSVKTTPSAPDRSPAQKPAALHAGDIKLF